ncbi:MAG: phosphotransferase [bacterium]|nr:phosphotransferase [bacterium]
MERSRNLNIELKPFRVIKSSGGNNRRLYRRLQIEHSALTLAHSYLPDKVPEVFSFSVDGNGSQIFMERLGLDPNVSFDKVVDLIEGLQTLPIDSRIPVYSSSDYLKNTKVKLKFLRNQGLLVGLGGGEVVKIRQTYSKLLPYLEPFKMVFVHGDIQTRHFAVKAGGLAIFDFDQAHFGNEFEDWAFLSIRHPFFSERVASYLRQKFADNQEQSAYLERAFLLMQIDKLLHVYFSRTYQWRGRLFDISAKIYARNKLRGFVSKAEVVSQSAVLVGK